MAIKETVRITHTPGNPPTVDKNRVSLSSSGKEEVEWEAGAGGANFVVCFETETPFNNRHFHPSNPRSGPPTVGPRGKPYKYTVEVDGDQADPEIKVDP